MQQIAITDFDFTAFPADQDSLIKAWLPEIEESARTYVPDDRFIAFLIAALRIGARSKSLDGFNLMQIIEKAGYSRSTFFRLFEGYSGFLLNGYKLTCDLSIRVYERHLGNHERTLDEFCKFTADVFFGANCTIPNEIVRMLWREHALAHADFHPHITNLAPIMFNYLTQNTPTQHLNIDVDELYGVVLNLDLDILNARIDDNPLWGTPAYYKKLHKMLLGYFLTCS